MKTLIKNGTIINHDGSQKANVLIEGDKIALITADEPTADKVIDASGKLVMPGLIDMHVHFRDPGLEYKDDINTGSETAVAGGVTTCCPMANTNPVNDNAVVTRDMVAKAKARGLIDLLTIDEVQADAILAMQLRRLAALERQKIIDELAEIEAIIADLKDILASPGRQRAIVRDELKEIVDKYGDDRRSQIIAATGDVTEEDLIARENVVVTITSTGYAKRTKVDAYKSQRRGGKGVRGAELKQDDVVRHFFVCSTHDWILFFTNFGRVYRLKAYELPEASRTARGQHVANLLEFQPEERIAQVIQIQSYEDAPYLVLATVQGRVKKSRLSDYESARSGGLIAINLNEGDKLIGASLCSNEDDLLLVSEEGQSIRFSADDEQLRPMGRSTAGVKGMRFRGDDHLLAMTVVRDGSYLLVATAGGYGKRTSMDEYSVQGRGGVGVVTFKYNPKRGKLIGALAVDDDDQIFAITSAGGVIRTEVNQIRPSSRATMGVRLVNLEDGIELLAIDRNVEGEGEEEAEAVATAKSRAPKQETIEEED